MENYLKEAIEVMEARKSAALNQDKKEVKNQEQKLQKIFKEAKENEIDTGLMNERLIRSTSSK